MMNPLTIPGFANLGAGRGDRVQQLRWCSDEWDFAGVSPRRLWELQV
jgi:hypothetical protein